MRREKEEYVKEVRKVRMVKGTNRIEIEHQQQKRHHPTRIESKYTLTKSIKIELKQK